MFFNNKIIAITNIMNLYHSNLPFIHLFFYRGESWRGFYKGLWPNILRVTPACCITFVVYEKLTGLLLPKPGNGR